MRSKGNESIHCVYIKHLSHGTTKYNVATIIIKKYPVYVYEEKKAGLFFLQKLFDWKGFIVQKVLWT